MEHALVLFLRHTMHAFAVKFCLGITLNNLNVLRLDLVWQHCLEPNVDGKGLLLGWLSTEERNALMDEDHVRSEVSLCYVRPPTRVKHRWRSQDHLASSHLSRSSSIYPASHGMIWNRRNDYAHARGEELTKTRFALGTVLMLAGPGRRALASVHGSDQVWM